MEYEYTYSRDWLEAKGYYDIGYFDPIVPEPSLVEEVVTALSIEHILAPIMRCNADSCKLIFTFELTTEQETLLNNAVAIHKANAAE